MDIDEDLEDVDVVEIQHGGMKVALAGVSASGVVFLSGDIHPLGAFPALMKAAKAHVPYISTGSVNAMFPSNWLRGECLHDADRLRVIGNMEKFVRGSQ